MKDIGKSQGFTQTNTYGNAGGIRKHLKPKQAAFHKVFSPQEDQTNPIHSEYAQALALMIQDFHHNPKALNSEADTKDQIQANLSDNLSKEFTGLVEKLALKSQSEDGQINVLELDTELETSIDNWTDKLVTELGKPEQKDQIKGQVDFYFDSLVDQINANSFNQEVKNFFDGNKKASQARPELIKDLASRYPLTKKQVRDLVDLLEPNRYSLANMTKFLKAMNKEYGFSKNKVALSKTGASFFAGAVSTAVGGFIRKSPLGIVLGNACMRVATFCNHKGRLEEISLLHEMKEHLNDRISDTLTLKEFGNLDDEKFAEIHTTLSRGRTASSDLITTIVSGLTPPAMTLALSSVGMAFIHPMLGAASLTSLPLILRKANKFTAEFQDLNREQKKSQKTSTGNIKDITDTAEDLLTSPNPELIKAELARNLNEEDNYTVEIQKLSHKMHNSFESTFWNTMTATAALGFGLYSGGQITEGEVFSSSFIAAGITSPFLNILHRSSDFLGQLQLVQEMEELIQTADTISLEEDAKKPGFSSLENHNIEFKNLKFTGDDGKVILSDINFKFPQGSFTTITGLSGQGKSTLLKCLLGFYKPSEGSVNIGNQARTQLRQNGEDSVKGSIAACSQSPKVLATRTLRENLTLYSKDKISDEKIHNILDQLGLSDFKGQLNKPITKPSGGQRARIGIARALLKGDGSTKILVLDEPTSGLDNRTRAGVIDMLLKLKQTRKDLTIICVTHNEKMQERVGNNFDLSDYIEAQISNQQYINGENA